MIPMKVVHVWLLGIKGAQGFFMARGDGRLQGHMGLPTSKSRAIFAF